MSERTVSPEVDILALLHRDSEITLAAAMVKLERHVEEAQEVIDLDTSSDEGATDE